MDKKLIAVDLDGTTLNQQSLISDKTKQVFQKAREAGHIISIATGRPYRNSKHYYDQLKMITPMINFNGALCHLPNEKNWSNQYHKTVSRDIALDMLDLKKEFDIKLIAAELLDSVYTDESFLPYPDFFPNGQKDVLKLKSELGVEALHVWKLFQLVFKKLLVSKELQVLMVSNNKT